MPLALMIQSSRSLGGRYFYIEKAVFAHASKAPKGRAEHVRESMLMKNETR